MNNNHLGEALVFIFCTPFGWVGLTVFFVGLYQALH